MTTRRNSFGPDAQMLYLFLLAILFLAIKNQVSVASQVYEASNIHNIRQTRDKSSRQQSSQANQVPRIKSTVVGGLLNQNQNHDKLSAASNSKVLSRSFGSSRRSPIDLLRPASQMGAKTETDQHAIGGSSSVDDYKCAKWCSCSEVQATEKSRGEKRIISLTKTSCESPQFVDLLAIDRRTHIIHISLPINLLTGTAEDSTDHGPDSLANNEPNLPVAARSFRMPRLIQFNLLREMVIINLQFEVCDSEVFKKGQKLRRLQLNHNNLARITKACLKHLDKLVELNLDYNRLDELESALFSSLLNLKSLSLANNQLTELAAHQFANLTQLTSLNLVGNSFKSINLQLLEPMQNTLRLLLLAKNQIKSFVSQVASLVPVTQQPMGKSTNRTQQAPGSNSNLFSGVIFKNLVKLNVDQNKLERIKLLQLHRFFNVKYLSIRQNNIATIRDKAFNGLKLIELNLAHNQLQTVSKCAFCNATIKRLVLANNNISFPLPLPLQMQPSLPAVVDTVARPLALVASPETLIDSLESIKPLGLTMQAGSGSGQEQTAPTSSSNMLILSQSILGPLFDHLEYLDLSNNQQLANQLESLLEPLLKLEYLNLATVGLDRDLPTPNLFRNLRQLRYLNLSHNQLDQVVAETMLPLAKLEVLDLSHNKFSELEETFLVTIDEMSSLRQVNLASNPWFCSQCKVAPLYDWILRSPIYNATCIAPSVGDSGSNGDTSIQDPSSNSADTEPIAASQEDTGSSNLRARGLQHYSLLTGGEEPTSSVSQPDGAPIDFDLVPGRSLGSTGAPEQAQATGDNSDNSVDLSVSPEDDSSIAETMLQVEGGSGQRQYLAADYCLRCEYPSELRSFNIHELQASDFKFCAGAAPRFAASEPKIGLTLAIVIIGALFCIIIVVIIMYRKKSNTYYTQEMDTDQLDSAGKSKGPVFSVSSDAEQQYGDNTDYSSPPMSQTGDSYSQDSQELANEEEDELEDEDLDDEGSDEEEAEAEDEELEEDVYFDDEDDDEHRDDNHDHGRGQGHGHKHEHGKDERETEVKRRVDSAAEDHRQADHSGGHHHHEHHTSIQRPAANDHHHHIVQIAESHPDDRIEIKSEEVSKHKKHEHPPEVAGGSQQVTVEGQKHTLATESATSAPSANNKSRPAAHQSFTLSSADRSVSGPAPVQRRQREPQRRQMSAQSGSSGSQASKRPPSSALPAASRIVVEMAPEVVEAARAERLVVGGGGHSPGSSEAAEPPVAGMATQTSSTSGSGGQQQPARVSTNSSLRSKRRSPPADVQNLSLDRGAEDQAEDQRPVAQQMANGLEVGAAAYKMKRATSRSSAAKVQAPRSGAAASWKPGLVETELPPVGASSGGHTSGRQQQQNLELAPSESPLEPTTTTSVQPNGSQRHRRIVKASQTSDHQLSGSPKLKAQTSGLRLNQMMAKVQPVSGSSIELDSPLPVPSISSINVSRRQASHVGGSNNNKSLGRGQRLAALSRDQRSSQPPDVGQTASPIIEPLSAEALGARLSSMEQEENGSEEAELGGRVSSSRKQPVVKRLHAMATNTSGRGSDLLPQQKQQQLPVHPDRSASASDSATTADSLALEALDYTASDLEEPPIEFSAERYSSSGSFEGSGALVAAESLEPHDQSHRSHRYSGTNHSAKGRLRAGNNTSLATDNFRLRHSNSNHSALTQTGASANSSREEIT